MIGICWSARLKDLTLLAIRFTTYDVIVFRLYEELEQFFFKESVSYVHGNIFSMWIEQMWIQDDYAISIWNVESYTLDNPNIIRIHINEHHPNV